MPESMSYERHYASSVLDKNDDLWVIGGTHDSKTADTTEVLQYQGPGKAKWRKGYALPFELRDTGKCTYLPSCKITVGMLEQNLNET